MKSGWTDQGAREAIDRWGGDGGEELALRLYTARLIGSDPALVLHGGGNVSVKSTHRTLLGDEVESLSVKGSGFDLAALEPGGLPAMGLAYLRRLRDLDSLSDDAMVQAIRTQLFDPSAPTPSIETLVHAFLPHRCIDHSHAGAVLAITNHADGGTLAREAMDDRVAFLPYVRPGFDLGKAVAQLYEERTDVIGIVLSHHGLITFGDDARTSYERHIELVDACERFIDGRAATAKGQPLPPSEPTSSALVEERRARAARIAPLLRGFLAGRTGDEDHPYRRSLLEWRSSGDVLANLSRADAKSLACSGPLTGDHMIHTKSEPLFVDSLDGSDDDAVARCLREAVDDFTKRYRTYVAEHGGNIGIVDAIPRVVLVPGVGLFAWGSSKRSARVTADMAEHTLVVKVKAAALGPYESLPQSHLYDMEFRGQQLAKLGSKSERPLEGHVVVISGGAGAIGAAVGEVCAEAGAHVALADLDKDRATAVARRIEERCGPGTAFGLAMDVTDEASVRGGFADVVRTFGGVDVIVPNAGIAHVASIENLEVADFKRVMEINAVGYLTFMREGIRILKAQGLGGHIIINSSKNVFGPGKDFGAYSASKAAGHQLGKVAAMELAPDGIRVNMINADAIFGDSDTPSGLWATVGPLRAKSRGMEEKDLPEYYRGRNLLGARVLGRHVGNAVVFFATNATPTTGATLPIDGGVVEAFPR